MIERKHRIRFWFIVMAGVLAENILCWMVTDSLLIRSLCIIITMPFMAGYMGVLESAHQSLLDENFMLKEELGRVGTTQDN